MFFLVAFFLRGGLLISRVRFHPCEGDQVFVFLSMTRNVVLEGSALRDFECRADRGERNRAETREG